MDRVNELEMLYLERGKWCRLARRIIGYRGSESDAEDVVQTSFVHAFEHLNSFRGGSSLKTWITKIVRNGSLNFLRKTKHSRSQNAVEILNEDYNEVMKEGACPASQFNQMIHLELLDCIAKLREPKRTLITMKFLEGWSLLEIAEEMNFTEGKVKSEILRGKERLVEILKLPRSWPNRSLWAPVRPPIQQKKKVALKSRAKGAGV